ncbi:hypothetical protein TKK_0018344 [Trichogramma kaykai]
MSTLVTLCAIFAALKGIVLLGSVSPASAYRSISFGRDVGQNYLAFSESIIENTTLYYLVDFSGAAPKEDECNITLRSEGGGNIVPFFTKIDSLGKDRAIVRWFEAPFGRNDPILQDGGDWFEFKDIEGFKFYSQEQAYRVLIDSEGVVSKLDMNKNDWLLSYSNDFFDGPYWYPLSKNNGYLLVQRFEDEMWPGNMSTVVNILQPNGNR